MARFDFSEIGAGAIDATAQADILFEMGMMYATGRDCDMDMVAAHKWFNIAAIKGSARAAALRSEMAAQLTKPELAPRASRSREWMTMH